MFAVTKIYFCIYHVSFLYKQAMRLRLLLGEMYAVPVLQ